MPKLAWMLDGVPPARLFDEVNKMFLAGSARPSFELLRHYGLLEHLFPDLGERARRRRLTGGSAPSCCGSGSQDTDERVRAEQVGHADLPVRDSAVARDSARVRQLRMADGAEAAAAARQRANVTARAAGARRDSEALHAAAARDVRLQPRFERRDGRRALRLLDHPRFRAAYDFLLLRAAAGEVDAELAQWWTDIQSLPADERIARRCVRERRPRPAPRPTRPRRRRRRRRAPPAAS